MALAFIYELSATSYELIQPNKLKKPIYFPMPETKQVIKIDQYIDMVLRRRWFIIIPFCLAMLAGIYLAITLPKVYQSETLILVEPQRVPTSYVQSVVSLDIDARISTISQQIMSRSSLEKIINEFNLFSGPEQEHMYLEDKLESLRKRISVSVTRARRGADAFSVSFKGNEPDQVMKVANALATYFINENLRVREAQAVGTSDFLDGELNSMRKKLEEVEETLKEYRKQYMGELPEQLETNLNILDRLQVQMGEREASLRNARDRLALIEKEIQTARESNVRVSSELTESEYETKIRQLSEELGALQTRYTDKHPDVIRLKKIIADLNAEKSAKGKAPGAGAAPPDANDPTSIALSHAQVQANEIKQEIGALNQSILELNSEVRMYQKRVENTPKREQELMSLRRDYNDIQESYSSLLSRKLEAEISVNMERKQKGEQFRIIDSAQFPTKPVSPDMKKLFIFTVAAGLGIGGGIIFLLDFLSTVFRRPEDIEITLGLPVLATVPTVLQPGQKRWRRVNVLLSGLAVIISMILFSGFGIMTFRGVERTLEFVQRFVNI